MSLHRQRPALDEHIDTRLLHERVLYRRDRPVLTLNFRSSETSTSGQPVFFNEDVIEGTVQLLGTKSVERVTFQGKGFIVTPDVGAESVFWSSEEVFTGSQSWRFSLRLPSQVLVKTKQGMTQLPLPPSYRRSIGTGMLEYHLAVTAYRGVLRESYRLIMPFIYVPRCTPEYPLWRTNSGPTNDVSVEEGYVDISPVGPRTIPGGSFSSLSPAELPYIIHQQSIQGVAFGSRGVLVTLRAMYNNPPIFARDAPIRIALTFESDDAQVLDLLTSNSSLQAHLEQRANFSRGQAYPDALCRASIYRDRPPTQGSGRQQLPIQRKVELCLECPRDACPSFTFPGLTLQHSVVIQITANSSFVPTVKTIPPLRLSIQLVTDTSLT